MRKTILIYGLLIAGLVLVLSVVEYRHSVRALSTQLYVGIVAMLFVALGLWLGRRSAPHPAQAENTPAAAAPTRPLMTAAEAGLSPREYEVLQLMAEGLSNQEIADQLFLSVHTIKTHTSNLYSKLDVKRRTQAVQEARDRGLVA